MSKEKYIERDGKRYKLVRKGKYSEITKPKTHKYLATKLLATFFVVFVALPAGVTFGVFYDHNTKDLSAISPENIEDTLKNRLFKELENIDVQNAILKLKFDDQTLDSVLMSVNDKFLEQTPVGDYIPKFYCTIDGNKYNFYADIRTGWFKTRASICTTLKNSEDLLLDFTVDSINLGRIRLGGGLIGNLVSNFVNDELINNALKSAHFNATFNFSDMSLKYKRDQFRQDVGNMLSGITESVPQMNLVFNMLGFDKDSIANVDYSNGVSVTLKLINFASKEEFTIPDSVKLDLNMKDTSNNTCNIVNDSTLKTTTALNNKDDITKALITYYNYGYSNSDQKIKDLVSNNVGLIHDNYSISDPLNYDGKITYTDDDKILVSANDISAFMGTSKTPISIAPLKLTKYLRSKQIIGVPTNKTYVLNNETKNAYFALDQFGFDYKNGTYSGYIGADINGITLQGKITLNSATGIKLSDDKSKIVIDISDDEGAIQIGSVKVGKDTITQLCNMFGGTSNFGFSDGKFSIDVKTIFGDQFEASKLGSVSIDGSGNIVLARA